MSPMFILFGTAWAGAASPVNPGVQVGVNALPTVSLSLSSDPGHVAGEVGVGWVPGWADTQYARLGWNSRIEGGDHGEWRVQPMVGVRRLHPGPGVELLTEVVSAFASSEAPSLETVSYATLTTTGEYTRWVSDGVGLSVRGTVGFRARPDESGPELALGAGLTF